MIKTVGTPLNLHLNVYSSSHYFFFFALIQEQKKQTLDTKYKILV